MLTSAVSGYSVEEKRITPIESLPEEAPVYWYTLDDDKQYQFARDNYVDLQSSEQKVKELEDLLEEAEKNIKELQVCLDESSAYLKRPPPSKIIKLGLSGGAAFIIDFNLQTNVFIIGELQLIFFDRFYLAPLITIQAYQNVGFGGGFTAGVRL